MRVSQVKPYGDTLTGNHLANRQLNLVNGVDDVDVTRFQSRNDEILSLDGRIFTADTAVPTEVMELVFRVPGVQTVEDCTVGV